ncbi:exodeoxyribonuclease VII large subunit, partial [Bifidobacteriaceae bacterium VN002]
MFVLLNSQAVSMTLSMVLQELQNEHQGSELQPKAQSNRTLPLRASETSAENPWPVSVISQKFHGAVEKWPAAWVEGQIVEINMRRSTSGYVTLRDSNEDVSISIMGFSKFVQQAKDLRQGDRVVVHGKADIW